MKMFFFFLCSLFLITSSCFGQYQRKVLVEDFTNSECPNCPPAYAALYSYEDSDTNAMHVSFIYYHMPFPYPSDPLYQANTSDPNARNDYYGHYGSTPTVFFNGKVQPNSYNTWSGKLDGLVAVPSPLQIILSGTKGSNKINLKSEITRNGDISQTDLVVHCVVVENIFYLGMNSVSRHDNVMRKMLPSAAGEPFSIDDNETKEINTKIDLDSSWKPDSLSVVVFVQSIGTKEIYQSETIKYSDLGTATDVNTKTSRPSNFSLEQNFPNPFNPSTKINYYIPKESMVKMEVYNLLGKKVAELTNAIQPAGDYNLTWNAENFSSGIYFLTIDAVSLQSRIKFTKTIKMILLK